jgi:poly(beta-D-mannuronate) lyase
VIRRLAVALMLLAAVPARADSTVAMACTRPAGERDLAPVIAVRGPAHKGTDRSIEPFALANMQAAAAWRGLRDEAAASRAVDGLVRWARSGALRDIVEAGDSQSNTNSIYSLRRALIAILGAWTDLRGSAAARAHAEEIERWLAGLVAAQDVMTGGAASRARGEATSNHNNHALLRATVAAQWAVLQARRETADSAWITARATLEEMRQDGSLPQETARGARALWYQRHALASLVYLAELLRPFGYDLWQPRSDGADLHRAVGFLLQAIDHPDGLAPYTGAAVAHEQDLGFLELRGNGRHYMAWAEFYRDRFPERDETKLLERLLPHIGEHGWPLIDDYVGGNATCRILTSRIPSGEK